MNQFPVDFTPWHVLNGKRQRRETKRREKIEKEKVDLRARIVETVTKDDEDAWWWKIKIDRSWHRETIGEIRLELLHQRWLLGHFPQHQAAIICIREPTKREITNFFE